MGLSTAIVYPLDLIHTRISTELTPKTERRQYHTTFDCFNRTHVDEGFKTGLYKGVQLSYTSSLLRSIMTVPMLDVMRTSIPDTENSWL